MGQYAAGNTKPVTGWRDWKARLNLSGAYAPGDFRVPTVTPGAFWNQHGYVNAAFPRGMSGTFAVADIAPFRSKWGLSGSVDDALAFVERHSGKILAGGIALFLLAGGKARRKR